MQSFINNLGVGVGFGSVLIGSLKTSGMTWSNLAEGASKLKNSKPVQTALDVTKIKKCNI